MKITKPHPTYGTSLDRPLRNFSAFISLLAALGFCAAGASAATLTWDVDNVTPGAQDGSGNWSDPNMWWNGGANVTWSDANSAVFGSGTAGFYVVTNTATTVSPTMVLFTNLGTYVLTVNGIVSGQLHCTTPSGGTGSLNPGISVATNITAYIDVPFQCPGDIFLGSNSVVTFSRSMYANSGGLIVKGSGPLASRLNITNGVFGGVGAANYISGTFIIGSVTVDVSGSGVLNPGTRFDLGRSVTGATGNGAGVVNVHDGGQLNVDAASTSDNNANLQLSRGGPPSTLNILPGGTVTTLNKNSGGFSNGKVLLIPDNGANGPAFLNVSGGVLSVGQGPSGIPGVSAANLALITLINGGTGYGNGASAIFNLSGGTVAAQGILIGPASGTFANNPTNKVNVTGGTLYLDAPSISRPVNTGPNFAVNLSGGTIGATANWSPACSVPMNLTNINGDITFQAADVNGTSFTISLSGALTGVGGLKKTGAGVLTLSGANNYAGTTVISNGTLTVSTINSPTNGPVTLEGDSVAPGLPINSVVVANVGQFWSVGNMTYDTGTPTADFNFGSFPPSTTVAPIQVNGNLAFTVTPQVTVEGSAIAVGDYPLWHYTGSLSGTAPTTPTSLPNSTVATIVVNSGTKTIYLHVTGSLVTPRLLWGIGNGLWDTTSFNWKQYGSSVKYTDGSLVGFDDTASGPFPITVTLNATVNPGNVQANSTNIYTIAGSGAIAGSTGVEKDGTGTLTLSGTNTYTGGTVVNAGQLNINYGGDGVANSAIGVGPLTTVLGSKLDNTSGHDVTLLTSIAENWNDDFTFVGTGNFNTGPGGVNLGSGLVNLTVISNTFEVDGQIQDGGLNYGLGKAGAGTLTLANYNFFGGGVTLTAGKLNINTDGAAGSGLFRINGGVLDNTSSSAVTLTTPSGMQWAGNFSFAGSTNLTISVATLSLAADPVNLTVSNNVFETDGVLNGGNRSVNKNGPGTWTLGGFGANGGVGININAGTVNFAKQPGSVAVNANPVAIFTNATLMLNPTGTQLGSLVPLTLSGGLLELNGDSETFSSLTFNSGIVRNSAASSTSTLHPLNGVSLVGTNCLFDVTATDGSLIINSVVSGTGGVVKTGAGLLNLATNSYAGNTTVSNGTLVLNFPSLAPNSTVTVNTNATLGTNAVLTLNFANSETNTVSALILGGVSKPNGIYNSTTDPLYIAGSGSLQVTPSINPLSGTIQVSVSGSTLSLSWPTNLGWILQSETNLLNNAWSDVGGSSSVTATNIPINPANPTMFFRLRHP